MAKIKCPSCGTKYSGNFCPNCSAPAPEQPKKKSKVIPIIVAIVVLFCLLGACMGGTEEPPKQPSSVNPDASAVTSDGSDSPDGAQSAPSDSDVSGSDASSGTASPEGTGEITVAQTEVYNQDGISVAVTGFDPDGLFGPALSVTITNSTDRDILVSSDNVVVNGYALNDASLYCTVAAGKSANDALQFFSTDVQACGIDTFAEISFQLQVIDADDYSTLSTSDTLTVRTSAPEDFVQAVDDSGDVVYDKNGVRVVCKGLKEDSFWDGAVVFYVENTTSRNVSVYTQDLSINGFMESDSFWVDLPAGTRTVDAMYILDMDDLNLESLDDVKEIEFKLQVIDQDSWDDIDTSSPITLNFGEGE